MGRKGQAAFAARAASIGSAGQAPAAPKDWAPDLSKVSRNVHDTDDEARRMRLRAKTTNFTCTFVARGLILLATLAWLWEGWQTEGIFDRKRALAVLVQLADLGRVIDKMLTPGTK